MNEQTASCFAELFPTRVRASGISFVQQIGALIGSVGTLAADWLLALAGARRGCCPATSW